MAQQTTCIQFTKTPSGQEGVIINFTFDLNKRYEYPIIELCNPDKTVIGIVAGISELVISPKWGSCSEVTFTVYKEINNKPNLCYEKLRKSRLIHVDGFGYFTIRSDDEELEDKITHKSIQAYSVEYLLNNKGINLTFVTTAGDINNTSSTTVITSNYFFYRETQPEKSLLHQLIKVAPQWSIGYVSSSLKISLVLLAKQIKDCMVFNK